MDVATKTVTFQEQLPETGGLLDLNVEVGQVEVHGHNGTDVVVTATVRYVKVDMWREGETVYVRAEQEKHFYSLGQSRAEINIAIPAGSKVRGKTVTGALLVSGVNGPVYTHVTTGNTSLRNLGNRVDASAVTGAIIYDGILVGDSHRFRTTTGNIHLALEKQPDARLNLETTVGSVACDWPMGESRRVKNIVGARLRGILGAGTGSIQARVQTGSVHLAQNRE